MRRSRTALPFLSAEVRPHRDRAPGGSTWGAPGVRLGDTGGVTGRLRGIPGGNVPARRLRAAINVLMALGVNYPPNGLLIIIRPCVIARRLRGIFQRDPGGGGGERRNSRSCRDRDIPRCPPCISGPLGGAKTPGLCTSGSSPLSRVPHSAAATSPRPCRRDRGRDPCRAPSAAASPGLRCCLRSAAGGPPSPRAPAWCSPSRRAAPAAATRRTPPGKRRRCGAARNSVPRGAGGEAEGSAQHRGGQGGYQGYGGVTEPVSAPGNGQRPRGGGRGGGQRRPVPASRPGGDLAASPGIAAPLFWGRSRPPPPGPSPSGPAPAPVSPAVPPPHTDTCPRPGGGGPGSAVPEPRTGCPAVRPSPAVPWAPGCQAGTALSPPRCPNPPPAPRARLSRHPPRCPHALTQRVPSSARLPWCLRGSRGCRRAGGALPGSPPPPGYFGPRRRQQVPLRHRVRGHPAPTARTGPCASLGVPTSSVSPHWAVRRSVGGRGWLSWASW